MKKRIDVFNGTDWEVGTPKPKDRCRETLEYNGGDVATIEYTEPDPADDVIQDPLPE